MFYRLLGPCRISSPILCHNRSAVPTQAQNAAASNSNKTLSAPICHSKPRLREIHRASVHTYNKQQQRRFRKFPSPSVQPIRTVTLPGSTRYLPTVRHYSSRASRKAKNKSIVARSVRIRRGKGIQKIYTARKAEKEADKERSRQIAARRHVRMSKQERKRLKGQNETRLQKHKPKKEGKKGKRSNKKRR